MIYGGSQIRNCPECLKEFKATPKRRQTFCSRECKRLAARPERICEWCKSTYRKRQLQNKQFCSWECFQEPRKHTIPTCHPDRKHACKGMCQACYDASMKKKGPERFWDRTLKRSYGISLAQWNKIFDLQRGLCPICEQPIYRYGDPEGRKVANVDHDHLTGRIRGLVHWKCNYHYIAHNNEQTASKVLGHISTHFDWRDLMTLDQVRQKTMEKIAKLQTYRNTAEKTWGQAIAQEMYVVDLDFYGSLLGFLIDPNDPEKKKLS